MKEFISQLLGGTPPLQFVSVLFIAYLTAFTMLLLSTTKRDPSSPRSPFCFSWNFLLSDEFKRIVGNVLLILLAVRFCKPWIPEAYNSISGFVIGLLSDKLSILILAIQQRLFNQVSENIKK